MSRISKGMALVVIATALTLVGVASAQATLSKTTRCSVCHGGPTLSVNAALASSSALSSTYDLSATGADAIAVFNGATRVALRSGSSGSVALPVGPTYTIFAVKGPGESDGLGQKTVTPVAPADVKAPVTASNAQASYSGNATIDLTPSDGSGGSGVAATYWILDGGAQTSGTHIVATGVGSHTLEFWSVDVAGNVETPHKSVSFTVGATLPTSISFATSSTVCSFGGTALFRGTLLSGSALAGKLVVLQYSADNVTWRNSAATALTDSLGAFVLSAKPVAKLYYRAIFAGDVDYASATSSAVAVTPRAWLSVPYAPLAAVRGRTFTSAGYLKPRHTAGTYPVRIQCYRVEAGKLVLRKTVLGKASNYLTYTKYAGSVALPYAGTWKIRAYHPADGKYAATFSSYRTVTVR